MGEVENPLLSMVGDFEFFRVFPNWDESSM